MSDYYISCGSSTTQGWRIPRGGRSCPPPEVKRVAITNIPYRDGDIDLTKADGSVHYKNRELNYVFEKSGFSTEAAADTAASALCTMLAGIVNGNLYDSKVDKTYTGVTCTGIEVDDSKSGKRVVTVAFTANPKTTGGTL